MTNYGTPTSADVRESLDYLESIGCHRESMECVAALLDRGHDERDIIGYNTKSALAAFIEGVAARLKDLHAAKGGCLIPDAPAESEEAMAKRWSETSVPPDAACSTEELLARVSALRLMVYRAEEASGRVWLAYASLLKRSAPTEKAGIINA